MLKFKILLSILSIGLVFLLLGCGSSKNVKEGQTNITVNLSQKSSGGKTNTGVDIENDKTHITYTYKNDSLLITHYNANLNCSEAVSVDATLLNGKIKIRETEDKSQALYSQCLYTISIEMTNFVAGTYEVDFDEAYGADEIAFGIDLENKATGTLSYERLYYPYNLANALTKK